MTDTRIQSLLTRLGWSRLHAARRLGVAPTRVRRWCDGRSSKGNPMEAPGAVLDWLEGCCRAVDSVPVPGSVSGGDPP